MFKKLINVPRETFIAKPQAKMWKQLGTYEKIRDKLHF